jgi:CheY-like chemotaxis protein
MMKAAMREYCTGCAAYVDVLTATDGGPSRSRCSQCGREIVEERTKVSGAPPPVAELPEMVSEDDVLQFDSVVISEDSPTLRQLLKIVLQQHGIGKEVFLTQNGEEFVQTVIERFAKGAGVNLAILDLEMPVLNGQVAAIVLRAAERAFRVAKKTPILFFSRRTRDQDFERLLALSQPAGYVNKGEGFDSHGQFARRLTEEMARLSNKAG